MRNTESKQLQRRAGQLMPGGVSSPVRAFRAVGGDPIFIDRGHGATVIDADGNELVDYVLSYGPLIAGHAHPEVVTALQETARRGTSYGASGRLEIELAEKITGLLPSVEMIRFVNSGTEATMSALRLARAATGRAKVVKFEGAYHGHADTLLVKAGSGVATLGLPDSPGVPPGAVADTILLPYNDPDAIQKAFEVDGDAIAAVIVEPVAGNMGVVLPREGYLTELREITSRHGTLLIFDEVMTAFRVHTRAAQVWFEVGPDITCLGKVIGGGLPVGAYGGSRSLMEQVAPSGDVYQAGTLSGNPLAMAAGLATLKAVPDGVWQQIQERTQTLVDGLRQRATEAGVQVSLSMAGTMFSTFFLQAVPSSWAEVAVADTAKFATFFHTMLQHGVLLPPSQFEACFVSAAHGERELQRTLEAAEHAFAAVASVANTTAKW